VRYAETDQMGVVYHTNYLVWCEVGRTGLIRARGMSYAEMERTGVGLAVSELSARFHAAARYDDMIRVRTTVAEVRAARELFHEDATFRSPVVFKVMIRPASALQAVGAQMAHEFQRVGLAS